jgi:hypothetical protein
MRSTRTAPTARRTYHGSVSQKAIDDTFAFDRKVGLLTSSQIPAVREMFNNAFVQKAQQGD